jgi:DNA-nicking Smr family endonuclease
MTRSARSKPTRLHSLEDLQGVLDELTQKARAQRILQEQQRRLQEQQRTEEIKLAQERQQNTNVFRAAMEDVEPIRVRAQRMALRPTPVAPIAAMRIADERAALSESLSDVLEPEALLEIDENNSWSREGIGAQVLRSLRRGRWVLQDELDLHRLRTEEAREALVHFLDSCLRRGIRCVRVVHGKGLGSAGREPVLKHKVPRWLTQRAEVLAFCQPREIDGGSGALLVLLDTL